MINILKHGTRYKSYLVTCSNCKCEFTCDKGDLFYSGKTGVINCPECKIILRLKV